jgi:peptidoglycan/xylan/chitin deacetylase (PgdA/CDA1 family)
MIDYTKFLKKNYFPIFLFHGVIQEKVNYRVRNYNKKHISKDYFYSVCSKLAKNGNIVTMNDVYKIITKKKKLPSYSYAITFDDGFLNNLSVASPILYDLNLPATFYVATNFIDKNFMSWVDRLERVLEDTSKNKVIVPWGSFKVNSVNDKIKFLKNLRNVLKSNPNYNPDDITNDIITQLDKKIEFTGNSDLDKKMNWKDIENLNSKKIFTIAPHSHNHKILSFCDTQTLNSEISDSINLLKKKTKINNIHFAYPDGQINHYNCKVINVLKKNGVKCCPTAITGVNDVGTNPFELKRIMVI